MAGEIGLWISFLSASPNELAAKLKMVEREMTEIKAENRLLRNRLAKFESDKNWVSKDTIDDESTGNNKVAGEKKKRKRPRKVRYDRRCHFVNNDGHKRSCRKFARFAVGEDQENPIYCADHAGKEGRQVKFKKPLCGNSRCNYKEEGAKDAAS
mmetsp:Transcript_33750/g.53144  ORF Transcript_33750/g.53144 Transcript_33750/m.53144 type:complete len:154 (-) Transcript_33750:182-643(-)